MYPAAAGGGEQQKVTPHIRQSWASSHEGRFGMPDPEFK
jgi:hypothetical protein